ncbi:glycosyltransferase family 2 protein [Cognatilysobacter terrigena]|uniref:glycosyltransferase family 2 protein n=1 Tax=Cognatilysobacter terrigena TaxID=2488749 RepID=UPI001FE4D2CF|nr:glycosyltransferase [Lysobacter terrigena]
MTDVVEAAPGDALPIVVIPVGVDDAVLDGCLAALEATTPASTRVWLADDACGGPRVRDVVDAWLATTRMSAEYGRRPRALGEAAHLADVLRTCGDADVVVLADDARPAPGWLTRMTRCLRESPHATSVTPWSNAGETAAWPRLGDVAPLPDDPSRIVDALAEAALPSQPLPAAVGHAVLLRGSACRRVGGVDATSYASWYAALIDLCLRLQAFGGVDLLCMQAYVGRLDEGHPADGDLDRVAARWPHWNARLAEFLMDDPLRAQRDRIAAVLAERAASDAQADLFGASP